MSLACSLPTLGLSRVLSGEGRRGGLPAPFEWRLAHQRLAAEHGALRDDQGLAGDVTLYSCLWSKLDLVLGHDVAPDRAIRDRAVGVDVALHQALSGQGDHSWSGEVALEVSTERDAPGPDVRLHDA